MKERKTPPPREQLFAELDAKLQDLLKRPVIRDHPEWQAQIAMFAHRFSDILIYHGQLDERYAVLGAEQRHLATLPANAPDVQHRKKHTRNAKRLQDEAQRYIHAHLAELNEETVQTFLEKPEWLGDYIRDFLNPEKKKNLNPDDATDRETASESLLGSLINCALTTLRVYYPHISVIDEVTPTSAYVLLVEYQAWLASENREPSGGIKKG